MNQPCWLGPKGQVNETAFCRDFLERYPLQYVGGHFVSPRGGIQDDRLVMQAILHHLSVWVSTSLAARAESLFKILKIQTCTLPPTPLEDRVYVANGTYDLATGTLKEENCFTLHRLSVPYNPKAAYPMQWVTFLYDLLEEEDIITLQEYLGYCLIPTTRAQKMLMIIGQGGEGKSTIGCVMNAILGESLYNSSIQQVEQNRFARANLEGKLLMVDDDMDMGALEKTNYLKTIITARAVMDVERKGIQSYQTRLYTRFLCFGNGALTALHDRSDGFFRRQIILTTKDRPADRVDDPYLAEKLLQEREGILWWLIEGLERLVCQDFQFTISRQARANLDTQIRSGNNLLDFLSSTGYIRCHPDAKASTSSLYDVYRDWCSDNAEPPLSQRTFSVQLAQKARQIGITPSCNIPKGGNRTCRGYLGIAVCAPEIP